MRTDFLNFGGKRCADTGEFAGFGCEGYFCLLAFEDADGFAVAQCAPGVFHVVVVLLHFG